MKKFSWYSIQLSVLIIFVFVLQNTFGLTDTILLDSQQVLARPWSIVTSIFAHASVEHLFYNIISLCIFGLFVENIAGKRRFFLVFFVSGILASFAAVFFYSASLGASGAIFGLVGFLAAIKPKMAVPAFGIPLPVAIAALIWITISFSGLVYPDETAYAAHLGGLAAGISIGLFLRKDYKENKKERLLSNSEISEWEEKYMKKA